MVKLPNAAEQLGRGVRERRSGWSAPSHHQWGSRFGRRREEMRQRSEPTTLTELEELTNRSVELMEIYNEKRPENFDIAMDLLRLQYNMNFLIICDKCKGTHGSDELTAPER